MKAFVFPGQGAQFVGMGKDLYDTNPLAKELFEKANNILYNPIVKQTLRRRKEIPKKEELPFAKTKNL